MRINKSLEEIVRLVSGDISIDQSVEISSIASLEKAGRSDIAFILPRGDSSVFTGIEKEKIARSRAGVLVAREKIGERDNFLIVSDPLAAFTQLVTYCEQQERMQHDEQPQISPLAQIGENVTMKAGVRVGPYAVIEEGVTLGSYAEIGAHSFVGAGSHLADSVRIHPHVSILKNSQIGAHTIIHSGAVIGSDGFRYQVNKSGLRKVPHIGTVSLGAYVEIGANCMIDRALFDVTQIGNGVKIDNGVHIAHNVIIGPSTAILANTVIGGSAKIGLGCQIGGQVAIKDNITIGDHVKIVSTSAVMNDIVAGSTVCGQPAVPFTDWKRSAVISQLLVKNFSRVKTLLGGDIRPASQSRPEGSVSGEKTGKKESKNSQSFLSKLYNTIAGPFTDPREKN